MGDLSNLVQLLDEHPCAPADLLLHGARRRWTAAELRAEVDAAAGELTAAGVAPGQPVAVALDGAEAVVAMLAVWRAEAVFVPINPRLPATAFEEVTAATRPAAVVDAQGVRSCAGGATHPPGVAFVLWTSGTTGRPKPVLHEHGTYVELLDRVLGTLRSKPAGEARAKAPPPNLIPVSMALNAGIYNALFGLRSGAALVVMDRFEPVEFARLVEDHGIRSTVLPPPALAMLVDHPGVTELPPLRYVRSITAPLSPFLARRFTEAFGVIVLNGYGQAELGEVIGWTARQGREHPDKVGSIGTPHPGVEIRIDEPDGNDVGELLIRAQDRARGYADGGDLADRIDADGFVRTGDLARVDAEGFVWIEGRAGDVINRGGNKVFPDEVEEVLSAVTGVRGVAVVPEPDDRLGEVPVAYVVVAGPPQGAVDDAALETACRAALVPYKVPVRFERVDSLPRNEIGKLLRGQLARGSESGVDR